MLTRLPKPNTHRLGSTCASAPGVEMNRSGSNVDGSGYNSLSWVIALRYRKCHLVFSQILYGNSGTKYWQSQSFLPEYGGPCIRLLESDGDVALPGLILDKYKYLARFNIPNGATGDHRRTSLIIAVAYGRSF